MSAEKRARELLVESRSRQVVRRTRLVHEDDALHAIEAALTSQWQEISTAPRDGTWIMLARLGHDEVLLGFWHRTHNAWWGQGGTDGTWKKWQEATKWLPLPVPPEGDV